MVYDSLRVRGRESQYEMKRKRRSGRRKLTIFELDSDGVLEYGFWKSIRSSRAEAGERRKRKRRVNSRLSLSRTLSFSFNKCSGPVYSSLS